MGPLRPCFRSGFARARRGPLERQRYQSSPVGRHGAFCGRLWHSYAGGGLLVGEGLPMIGKLLGHNHEHTTARYAHLANDPLKSAANRIALRIAEVAG